MVTTGTLVEAVLDSGDSGIDGVGVLAGISSAQLK